MKRGSFCDIINVNKEKQRRNNTTLGDSARYLLQEDLNVRILVHCILLCRKFENSLWEAPLIL